jgi:predicted DNA-binding transcriptional regulator YafY
MSKHSTIRRYSLIIEKIGRKTYPSFEDIRNYMHNHGFELSERTIQRDLEQIRNDFGVDILYDRQRNGYYIDDYAGFNMHNFLRFMEIANTAELIIECLKESKHAIDYFDFESKGNLKGVEFIKPLLYAIRNNRKIIITHERFSTGLQTEYEIMPYMLKEYLYRWYLVGIVSNKNEFRTFGVDRIVDLVVLKRTFKPVKRRDPRELFVNTIGLTYSLNKLSEVILSFTPLQGKYIKSLPLHDSQEVIIDNDKELRISLYVIPNIELKQRILMMGEAVRVIEPDWLVEEVRDSLRAALKNYVN